MKDDSTKTSTCNLPLASAKHETSGAYLFVGLNNFLHPKFSKIVYYKKNAKTGYFDVTPYF
jgi:hypothetical protein